MKKEKTIKNMLLKNSNYNKHVLLQACKKAKNDILKIKKGEYIELFKNSNLKLEENIKKTSIPEVMTCCVSCRYCYAKKRTFDNVKIFRLKNLIIFEYAIKNKNFKKMLLNNIKKELNIHFLKYGNRSILRLHESGDFYNFNYFKLWLEVIKNNKKIKFFTYTKNLLIYNEFLKIKNEYKNLNIVNSYNLTHVNYYDITKDNEVEALENFLIFCKNNNKKVFLCNYGLDKLKLYFLNRYKKKEALKLYKNIILFFKKYQVSFYQKHMPCGVCTECTKQKYDYIIFLKH